ncbi:MAG: mechanosensitive ion channel family protein [Candidatus Thorarchaeota archaeon]|jgi:small-conductance mechanosensitive channel
MQTITTPPGFFVDPIGYIQFYWDQLLPYLLLVLYLIILMVIYLLVTNLARRSLHAAGMGPEAATGIGMVLRLMFFIAAIMIVVNAFEANLATILSLTALFGTALGLAFSQALGNIVSGLYVLTARPFRVGDYVRIGMVEGVVRDVTLNYTRVLLSDESIQLVPNSKVVGSEVTNFRVDVEELIESRQEEVQQSIDEGRGRAYIRKIDSALDKLKDMATDIEAYRYTFDLTIHMSFDHLAMRKHFDKVCADYEEIFLTRPTYIVWAKPSAAVTYRFAYIAVDPMVIIHKNSEFMDNLLKLYMKGR